MTTHEVANEPNDLARFFIERANAGDVEGLVALYEPDAVVAFPPGSLTKGHDEIRKLYEGFVAAVPPLTLGKLHPPLVNGDLAMTTATQVNGDVSVEIARRQGDGGWLWVLDQPGVG